MSAGNPVPACLGTAGRAPGGASPTAAEELETTVRFVLVLGEAG
jgi:hypothetical protein